MSLLGRTRLAAGSWLPASQAGVPFLPTSLPGMLLLFLCVPEATLNVTLPGPTPLVPHTPRRRLSRSRLYVSLLLLPGSRGPSPCLTWAGHRTDANMYTVAKEDEG